MPEVISNTSPLQYLHQLDLLDLLPTLYGRVLVPSAVVKEIEAGRSLGVALPVLESLPWIRSQEVANAALLPLVPDLGAGEREVLALALEHPNPLIILDDSFARSFARELGLSLTGTLGLLLKGKEIKRIARIEPYVDHLEALNFRLDPRTRADVLKLAGEQSS
jgi:predicted nucleic acid-binding protein